MQVRQGTIEKSYHVPTRRHKQSTHPHEGEVRSVNPVLSSLKWLNRLCLDRLHTRFVCWTRPLPPSLLLGTIAEAWEKQVRTHDRKCALTPTAHHAQSAGEMASMHKNGSHAPHPVGKGGSDMETKKQRQAPKKIRARQLFGAHLYFNCKTLFYGYTCVEAQ